MIKKLLLAIYVILFGFSFTQAKILGNVVDLKLSQEMRQSNRDGNMFGIMCPIVDHNGSSFLITDIDIENHRVYCSSANSILDTNASDTGAVVNFRGQEQHFFNMAEIDDPAAKTSGELKVREKQKISDYHNKLQSVVDNAGDGNNTMIYPLRISNMRGLYYTTQAVGNNGGLDKKPFMGFLGAGEGSGKPNNDNLVLKLFGLTMNGDDAVNNSNPKEIGKGGSKSDGTIFNWTDLGYSIGLWIDGYVDKSETSNLAELKSYFTWKADDSKQTWSRVMTGVATLDDAYLKTISAKGELIVRNAGDPISQSTFKDTEWWKNKFNKDQTFDNIWQQTSDGRLWGYYFYLSQNLHKLEMYIILAFVGCGFSFLMGNNAITYFKNVSAGAEGEKTPINWKKEIGVPMLGIMFIAVPLLPTNATMYDKFLLDTEEIADSIQVNSLNGSSPSKPKDSAYNITALQQVIQGMSELGSNLGDMFSKRTSFAFATYISFRENMLNDPTAMLETWKMDYNQCSGELINLNRLMQFYLSTCKYDYSFGRYASQVKDSATILPSPFNLMGQNLLQAKQKDIIEDFKNSNFIQRAQNQSNSRAFALVSPQACAKIESSIHDRSELLFNKMYRLANEITTYSDNYIQNAQNSSTNNEKSVKKVEMQERFKRLAFYEQRYGWINTAMLPLLYQIFYPSFDPYTYRTNREHEGVGRIGAISDSSWIAKPYIVIGEPTETNEKYLTSLKEEKYKKSNSINSLEEGLVDIVMPFAIYNMLPGYQNIKKSVKEMWNLGKQTDRDGNVIESNNWKEFATSQMGRVLTLWVSRLVNPDNGVTRKDGYVNWAHLANGTLSQKIAAIQALTKGGFVADLTKNKAGSSVFGKAINALGGLADALAQELVTQVLYIYAMNLIIMVVLTLVIVFKIGMYFVQLIVFFMASPLVVMWALLKKKQEAMLTYVGKASTVMLSPVLIVISTSILIVAVGCIHQLYYIIANHIINIQLVDVLALTGSGGGGTAETNFNNIADYVQMNVIFGIGDVLIGFSYLFLGYIIIVKFSHWFFDTIGVQSSSLITQGLETMTHRIRFGTSFGA